MSDVITTYTKRLTEHIYFVRQAGRKIGVPNQQLLDHDWSKWLEPEFKAYANYYHSERTEKVKQQYAYAWLHHIHHNKHHWQYWILPDATNHDGTYKGVIRMPDRFVLEMVADWMGASKAYTGSWDMTDWLMKNYVRVRLHPESRKTCNAILKGMGYEVQ